VEVEVTAVAGAAVEAKLEAAVVGAVACELVAVAEAAATYAWAAGPAEERLYVHRQ
jgi:hypothetical protein